MSVAGRMTRGSLRRGTIVLATVIMALSGTSPGASAGRIAHHPAPREFAYSVVGTQINQYAASPDGTLKPLRPAAVSVGPVPPHSAPGRFILHPTRPFVFIQCGRYLLQYRIHPNGQISRLPAPPVPLSGPYADLVMDPQGRFLYVVKESGVLDLYRIANNGRLYPQPSTNVAFTYSLEGQRLRVGGAYYGGLITIDPGGEYLYAYNTSHSADHWDSGLAHYQIKVNGKLVQVGKIAYGPPEADEVDPAAPVVFGPDSHFAYVTEGHSTPERFQLDVLIRRVGPLGTLLPISSQRKPTGSGKLQFIDPTGRLAVSIDDGDLLFYRVGPHGMLSLRSRMNHKSIIALAIDPAGRFLVARTYDNETGTSDDLIMLIGPNGHLRRGLLGKGAKIAAYFTMIRFLSRNRIAVSPGQSTGMQQAEQGPLE